MASPSSSSSSSKHNQPAWRPSVKLNMKKLETIDDYINSYFTANLLRPQLPHLNKPTPMYCQPASDVETPTRGRSENHRKSKSKNKTEAEKISELAREMDRMLSRAKSKRQTNDLLQLFKNTLSNFIVPEHPMDGSNTLSKTDLSLKNKKHVSLSTTPTFHQQQHYDHHYQQYKSQELNQFQQSQPNFFSNHETSMTMTTTTTRCQIKEPKISVIESSKTNILHRCYGKQSVKALPQIYKSRKKNNGCVPNCQKPPSLKMKSQKLQKLQHQRVTNQQMKTIYENDQFDKSKILMSKNSNDVDNIIVNNSSSASSVDTDKQSTIKMQISNELISNDSDKNLFNDHTVSEITGIRKQATQLINSKNEEHFNKTDDVRQIADVSIEQDNSIVQRLTSFWNKKLNTLGQTKSMSDQSSVTSSLMSVFEEEYSQRENNLNRNDKTSTCEVIKSEENFNQFSRNHIETDSPNDRGDISFNQSNNKSNEKVVENKTSKFRGKNTFSQNDSELPDLKMGLMNELLRVLQNRDAKLTGNKNTNGEAVTQNLNDSQEGIVNADLNSETRSKSHISVNLNDTGDEGSDFDTDDYDEDVEDYIEQCDEKTLEVIEKCLLDDMKNEDNNNDVEDFLKKQTEDSMKYKEMKNGYDISNDDGDNLLYNIKGTSTNINEPNTVITNVNSIITNLKQLIQTIDSIPDELKSVNMNLNSLPIPDKIKNKITTLIVSQDNERVDDKLALNASSELNQLMLVSPVEQKQLFRCCSSGKIIGYTKREGCIYFLYFPKMLTIPIIENVKNPFQKILFPKRNEFLKMIKNESHNGGLGINKNGTIDQYSNILYNNAQKEQNDEQKKQEEQPETCTKNCSCEEKPHDIENIQDTTKKIDKEITEMARPRFTQSSIIYLTSQPSSAFKSSSENVYVGQKYPFVLKPNIKTANGSPRNNLPLDLNTDNKTAVKFEDRGFIENNSVSNNNSVEELSDRSGMSSSPSNFNQQEEYHIFTVENANVNDNSTFQIENETLPKESRVIIDEGTPNLLNDLSAFNRHFNNNIKRRRYRLQNHNEDDTSILAGGSGDSMQNCGDVIMQTPIPCRNTSSMSVVVSNSINDSNSQPDININDSELNLSRLRVYGHCSVNNRTQDSDNFSTCGVIQEERSEEQLSDIDVCVIIEEHSNKKENKNNSFGTRSSTSISSQNINLSDNQENKKDSFDLVLISNSSQNINLSNNLDDQKNLTDTVSSSSISSKNINSSNNLNQDVSLVKSQKHIPENKSSGQRINGKTCDLKFSYLNLKNVSNEESTSKVLCIYKEDVNLLQSKELELKSCDKKKVNENHCDQQFLYQNLKNMLQEETITVSQSLPNNNVKDEKIERDKKQCNEICSDKKLSYQSLETVANKTVTKNDEFAKKTRTELKLHSSSSVPGSSPMNSYMPTNVSLQNVDFCHDLCNNSCENVSFNQEPKDKNTNNEKEIISIIKKDFHQNYQTYYFETELSNQAQLAIANKAMQNTYKNDLEAMLRNDAALESELSKIIDINNLCEKEKQLIAACICLMNRNFYNKQPPLFNVSVGNLSLNSSLTTLWNKTSKTMCNRIKLAKKSLIPYDFQTDTLLYQRCYRRLLKSFYTLFITLILIILIQKNFCGILLPINFPW